MGKLENVVGGQGVELVDDEVGEANQHGVAPVILQHGVGHRELARIGQNAWLCFTIRLRGHP